MFLQDLFILENRKLLWVYDLFKWSVFIATYLELLTKAFNCQQKAAGGETVISPQFS